MEIVPGDFLGEIHESSEDSGKISVKVFNESIEVKKKDNRSFSIISKDGTSCNSESFINVQLDFVCKCPFIAVLNSYGIDTMTLKSVPIVDDSKYAYYLPSIYSNVERIIKPGEEIASIYFFLASSVSLEVVR